MSGYSVSCARHDQKTCEKKKNTSSVGKWKQEKSMEDKDECTEQA